MGQDPRLRLIHRRGLLFWRVEPFERFGCRALFFQRRGGMSRGPYAGLNLGLHTSDDARHVGTNRRIAFQAGGLGPYAPVLVQQVHGSRVRVVTARQAGRGWHEWETALPQSDALISRTPGLPLGILTADCLPVVLVDEKAKAVAVLHAGWRGIVRGVVDQTLDSLIHRLHIPAQRLWAALGPCICGKCFEVKNEVFRKLNRMDPEAMQREKKSSDSGFFNLALAVKNQLIRNGILSEKIIKIPECTFCFSRKYYSYRRDGIHTGRMLAVAQILS